MHFLRHLPWSAAGLLAAACSSNQDLQVHDHGLPQAGLRFAVRSFEVEATGGSGHVAAGDLDYNLSAAQFLLRYPLPTEPLLAVTPLLGVEALHFGTAAPNGLGLDGFTSFGGAAGIDLRRRLLGGLSAYGRGTATWLFEPARSLRAEVGLSYVTEAQVELFAAMRWWRLSEDGVDLGLGGQRDLDLRTDGVVLGVGLRF